MSASEIIVCIVIPAVVFGLFTVSGIMYSKTSNSNSTKHKKWKIMLIISAIPTVILASILTVLPYILIFMLPLMSM